jgi:hypothetical protein
VTAFFNGGVADSYGDNYIGGNPNNQTAPTKILTKYRLTSAN